MDTEKTISLDQWKQQYLHGERPNGTTPDTTVEAGPVEPESSSGEFSEASTEASTGDGDALKGDSDSASAEFYDRLGVAPDVTINQLRDRFETIESSEERTTIEDEERFQGYAKAYDLLSDPRLRAWYDHLGHEEFVDGWASLEGWPDGVSPARFGQKYGYSNDSVYPKQSSSTVPSEQGMSPKLKVFVAGGLLISLAVAILLLL